MADDIASTRNKYGSWIEDGTDISYLSDGNKVKANEWRNMSRAYLIAMSTQRYLALNNDARLNALQCYRWGKRRYRDLFVCDEAFEDVTIRDWYYSDLKRYAGIIRDQSDQSVNGKMALARQQKKRKYMRKYCLMI